MVNEYDELDKSLYSFLTLMYCNTRVCVCASSMPRQMLASAQYTFLPDFVCAVMCNTDTIYQSPSTTLCQAVPAIGNQNSNNWSHKCVPNVGFC